MTLKNIDNDDQLNGIVMTGDDNNMKKVLK